MPPTTLKKCTPHLPVRLVETLREKQFMQGSTSAIYTETFHRRRLRFVDQTRYGASPDDYVDAEPLYGEPGNSTISVPPSSSSVKRTALHHAAAHADHLAVCELIRCGRSCCLCAAYLNTLQTRCDYRLQGLRGRHLSRGRNRYILLLLPRSTDR